MAFRITKMHVVPTIFVVVAVAIGLSVFQLTQIESTNALPAKPNILLLISDDQPCDQHKSTHCDTVDANMKFLASEPGGSWITSLQTRYHGSLCCPDRASFLTGQTNIHNKQFDNGNFSLNESETLATAVKRGGYTTGLFGKYLNPYKGPRVPAGWDRWIAHHTTPSFYNFDLWDNGTSGSTTTTKYKVPKVDNETYDAYWFSTKMNQWINQQSSAGKPWLAYFAAYAPHAPGGSTTDVVAGEHTKINPLPNQKEGCLKAVDTDITDKPSFVRSNKCTSGARTGGAKSMVSLDHAYKRIYNNLVANGQLDNTIIIYVGDNGMAEGSHNIKGKQCAYEECHTNPWMMRIPGRASGTINRLVSNVDLMPTILDLTGTTTSLQMDGRSIVPLLNGDTSNWRIDHYQHNGNPANPIAEDYDTVRDDCIVRNPCFSYTLYFNGEREMYNLTADPYQLKNLLPNPLTGYAGQPGWNDSNPEVQRLKQALSAHMTSGN